MRVTAVPDWNKAALILHSLHYAAVDEDSSSHDSGHDYEPSSTTTSTAGSGEVFACPQRSSSDDEERSSVDEGIVVESQQSSLKQGSSSSTFYANNDEETKKQYLKVYFVLITRFLLQQKCLNFNFANVPFIGNRCLV